MNTDQNPWVGFYEPLKDERVITALAEKYPAPPEGDLRKLSTAEARAKVEKLLAGTYVVTCSVVSYLRFLIDYCQTQAAKRYPDRRSFVANIYRPEPVADPLHESGREEDDDPDKDEFWPVCIIGHAGAGKSALGQAFRRLIGVPEPVFVDDNHSKISRSGVIRHAVNEKTSIDAAYSELIQRLGGGSQGQKKDRKEKAQQNSYRCGLPLYVLDELQNFSPSGATAAVVGFVFSLIALCIPFAFICNYSLFHAIEAKRPHQSRSRMTGNVLHVQRPTDPEEWASLVTGKLKALSSYFKLEDTKDILRIGTQVGWLVRYFDQLTVLAFERAHANRTLPVTIADYDAAYRSSRFYSQRKVVEYLHNPDRTRHGRRRHPDLHPPDGLDPDFENDQHALNRNKLLEEAFRASALDSLKKDEKEAINDLSKVVRRAQEAKQKKPKISLEILQANWEARKEVE